MLDRRSVTMGYAAAMRRCHGELEAFKQETVAAYAELQRELEQARDELHATKMEFLRYKQLVTHDKQQLAEIERQRAEIAFLIAQREPEALLN